MTDPVLFVIDDDPRELAALERLLRKRYGADYRVLTAGSPGAALDALERLAHRGEEVALVAADLRLPGMDGVEFLERAHALHRGVVRALLVEMDEHHTRIPFSELATLQRATAFGRIDFWVVKGWVTPEEWLYPQVQEALSAWTRANRPRHVVYRIVGEQGAPRSHALRDMLTRNSVPFEFYPVDSEEGHQLLSDFGVEAERLPAVIRHDGSVLHDPTFADVAGSHGIHTRPSSEVYDLAILGAGPAGLAAAVYGASEGLRTLVMEHLAIGGQAGTSSMIRNYLGGRCERRRTGAPGVGASRALWGSVRVHAARNRASDTRPRARDRALRREHGRRPGGDFYGAAGVDAPAMAGEEVYVVGGANSAGQAALHLAKFDARVMLLVRGTSLAAGMSDYLIRQIEATPNVEVRLGTRVIEGSGEDRLEALTLEDVRTGLREDVAAAAVFVLIGAEPRTEWLRGVIRRDEHGFILTGRDVPRERWPLTRPPLPFETSIPRVFAAGDVRYGSVKRVAGAVGEGSVTVGSVHQYLSETIVGVVGGQ